MYIKQFIQSLPRSGFGIALLVSLLIHLSLMVSLPQVILKRYNKKKVSSMELSMEYVRLEDPFLFMETNPHAKEKDPVRQSVISNRSQRAAELIPDLQSVDTFIPQHVKESDVAHKIIEGSPFTPIPPNQLAQKTAEKNQDSSPEKTSYSEIDSSETQNLPIKSPIPQLKDDPSQITLKDKKQSDESQSQLRPKDLQKKVIYINDEEMIVSAKEEIVNIEGDDKPKPRKRLQFTRVAGPIKESLKKVSEFGVVSIDASFSEFGDYLQRMLETISYQWSFLAYQSQYSLGTWGSRVFVSFEICKDGSIKNITIEYSTASEIGSILCTDAIASRAPYGEWTHEMIGLLGDQQKVFIGFSYL